MDKFASARDCIEHVRSKSNRCITTEDETWYSLRGYEGLYEITPAGQVRRVKGIILCKGRPYNISQKLLRKQDNGFYFFYILFKDGKRYTEYIHRLLYRTFVGEIVEGFEIDHINRDGHDNRLENIRLVDSRENKINRSITIKTPCVREMPNGKWQVAIWYKDGLKYLGVYETSEQGTEVYQKAIECIKQGTFEDYYESKRYKRKRTLPPNIVHKKNRYYVTIRHTYYGSFKTLAEAEQKVNQIRKQLV